MKNVLKIVVLGLAVSLVSFSAFAEEDKYSLVNAVSISDMDYSGSNNLGFSVFFSTWREDVSVKFTLETASEGAPVTIVGKKVLPGEYLQPADGRLSTSFDLVKDYDLKGNWSLYALIGLKGATHQELRLGGGLNYHFHDNLSATGGLLSKNDLLYPTYGMKYKF